MTTTKKPAWDKGQVRDFVKQVRRETGDAWDWMIPRLRSALIHERAFNVVRGQHSETVRVEQMDKLVAAMLIEAGLANEEEGDAS